MAKFTGKQLKWFLVKQDFYRTLLGDGFWIKLAWVLLVKAYFHSSISSDRSDFSDRFFNLGMCID